MYDISYDMWKIYRRPEEKQETLTDIVYDADEARNMDYRTTTEIHYRSPHPMKRRTLPPPPPPPPEPWLLNRRTIGYSLEELEKRNGTYTFLDDNMELHKQIADLKSRRYKLRTFQDSQPFEQRPINVSNIKDCKDWKLECTKITENIFYRIHRKKWIIIVVREYADKVMSLLLWSACQRVFYVVWNMNIHAC